MTSPKPRIEIPTTLNNGRVTIPNHIRQPLGLSADDEVVLKFKDGILTVLTPKQYKEQNEAEAQAESLSPHITEALLNRGQRPQLSMDDILLNQTKNEMGN